MPGQLWTRITLEGGLSLTLLRSIPSLLEMETLAVAALSGGPGQRFVVDARPPTELGREMSRSPVVVCDVKNGRERPED